MDPEFRLFLLPACVLNPPPAERPEARAAAAVPLVGLLLPKVIELGLGGIATLLKKAGSDKVRQVTATEIASYYVTDRDQRLRINPALRCVLGIYGAFAGGGRPPAGRDEVREKLEAAGLVPQDADIAIVFEAAIVPSRDETAFHLETRHFSVRDFIKGGGSDRAYVASFTVSTPNATADGSTIALGHVSLGQNRKTALPIPPGHTLGAYPRYRSNLMPWKRITQEARDAYEAQAKRNEAAEKEYMPVTIALTLSETADGNRFLTALGELLDGAKRDAATELGGLVVPEEREKAAREEADAAEKLLRAEEDALIAVKEAEAALEAGAEGKRAVLEAKLAKARRALDRARALRRAAGLPDLPGIG